MRQFLPKCLTDDLFTNMVASTRAALVSNELWLMAVKEEIKLSDHGIRLREEAHAVWRDTPESERNWANGWLAANLDRAIHPSPK